MSQNRSGRRSSASSDKSNVVLNLSAFLDHAWNRAHYFKKITLENLELVESVITPGNLHSQTLRMIYEKICRYADAIPRTLADRRARPLKVLRDLVSMELATVQQTSNEYVQTFKEFVSSCIKYLECDLRKADFDLACMSNISRDSSVFRMCKDCWTRMRDIRIRLAEVDGMPEFDEFWSTITEIHEEVSDLKSALGTLQEGPSFLEEYFGDEIYGTWYEPILLQKRESVFTDHENDSSDVSFD